MLLTLHRNHISERNFLSFKYNSVNKYRKIPDISPGLILFQMHFFGGLITGGVYIRGRLRGGGGGGVDFAVET